MTKTATFHFMGNLTDFFKGRPERGTVEYKFKENPSVKDAIEALGVPHTEVQAIMGNGQPWNFADPLTGNAEIFVYGWPLKNMPETAVFLQPPVPEELKFVADGHLGKLARRLRWLGFDTLCDTYADDQELIRLALLEDRIILTRDLMLLKFKVVQHGYWLRSQNPQEQLQEVVNRYNLLPKVEPFCRCSVCNGLLKQVPKAQIITELEPKTKQYFDTFNQCQNCHKIYWQGSHFDKMLKEIGQLKNADQANASEPN